MRLNTAQLFQEGLRLREVSQNEDEAQKVGNLRGGDVGCMLPNNVVGTDKCMRRVYARWQNIDLSHASAIDDGPNAVWQELMFNGGRLNEDGWVDALQRAHDGTIKREEEIAVKWVTSNGTTVSGRPDIVLCDKYGVPQTGIELKGIFSAGTARDVLHDRPRVKALMQAGHYSMLLNDLPFDVHYTSRCNWNTAKSGWPKDVPEGRYDPISNYMYQVGPFNRTWTLQWEGDTLLVNGKESVISKPGIRDYYETLSELGNGVENFPKETLRFDRHTGQKAKGAKWQPDTYCPLRGSGFCCVDEKSTPNVKEWREAITQTNRSVK